MLIKKMYHGFHKVLNRTTICIIDNNKKQMNKWFLKDHVRLKDPKDRSNSCRKLSFTLIWINCILIQVHLKKIEYGESFSCNLFQKVKLSYI